jgi:hypothetical protein
VGFVGFVLRFFFDRFCPAHRFCPLVGFFLIGLYSPDRFRADKFCPDMFCLRAIKIGRCAPSSSASYSRGGRERRRRRRRGAGTERGGQLHCHQEDQRDLRPLGQGPVLQVSQGKGELSVVVALLKVDGNEK